MVLTPIPTASRTGLARPSAPISSRAAIRLPSPRLTRAASVRVSTPVVAVPGRKSTPGRSAIRAKSTRRKSQFGKFQPKGPDDRSAASKSRVWRGSIRAPPASTMRIT